MIRVTIELLPGGREDGKRTLATGTIANTATGSLSQGTYFADFRDAAGRPWRHGTVTGFPRKRLLAWDLLYRALKNLVGDRN
jgi:hypothetical protein